MFFMNIIFRKQSQFELFPGASGSTPQTGRTVGLTKDLTLSLENIIVLSIVFVMTMVFLFSCGVERGKKLAALSLASSKADQAKTMEKTVADRAAEKVLQPNQEEQVVFPVEIPREITEDQALPVLPPVEKNEEQEQLFTIQVASFKLQENAQKEADLLRGTGHDEAFVLPKGSYSIVCVGKFIHHNEAKRYSAKLKKKYNDCMVRRL
jgi:hypothetical protein